MQKKLVRKGVAVTVHHTNVQKRGDNFRCDNFWFLPNSTVTGYANGRIRQPRQRNENSSFGCFWRRVMRRSAMIARAAARPL